MLGQAAFLRSLADLFTPPLSTAPPTPPCTPVLLSIFHSECWRAPAAVMVREVSPPGLGSTASAMHLCIRNLVGGLGPIGVALLSSKVRRKAGRGSCA